MLIRAGGSQLESSFAEKALGILTDTKMPLWQTGPAVSWATSEGALLAGQERGSFPLYSALVRPQLQCCLQQKYGATGESQTKGHEEDS